MVTGSLDHVKRGLRPFRPPARVAATEGGDVEVTANGATALTVIMARHHRSVEPQARQACCGRGHPVKAGSLRAHLRRPGEAAAGSGVVRGRRRRPRPGQAAGGLPGVLPRALRAPAGPRSGGGALRLRRGGSATPAAVVPATDREQRRAHRARVRPAAGAHRSADHLAAPRWRGTARGGQIRHRVQGAAREPGAHDTPRVAADRRLHGPVCGAGGPPGHLRPRTPCSNGSPVASIQRCRRCSISCTTGRAAAEYARLFISSGSSCRSNSHGLRPLAYQRA